MNLVFLGPPGAGKGTQATRVSEALSIPHISSGDMFRRAMREGTPTGQKAKAFIDQGQLVPDEIVIEMIAERLSESDCQGGFLLDGFPRTLEQAKALEKIVPLDAVVDITVEDDKLIKRLAGRRVCPSCGGTYHVSQLAENELCPDCGKQLIQRGDDQPETVANRLKVYHAQTSPLTEYYSEKKLIRKVDGDLPMEQVAGAILKALANEL